ncbi:uncharacterized protein LOC119737681 [Patiria miniata]|uniref:RING-type domain-containing protein n=1 Tax=Patiria miniata TaxID=46514 RepID=A0A914AY07_PATMI|nr:uncharacterized protein LOC119737681 [Patiria miniata]
MDAIDSKDVLIRDAVEKSAAQVLQDDIVAYLKPMFPYLLETMIKEIVVRQSRLLADPLDQNRLTNSCIDELLNSAIFTSNADTRAGDSESYIDLTNDFLGSKKTTRTEGFTDFSTTPDLFEANPTKDNVDVNRNAQDKPSSDLNRNNSGQVASDGVTGSDLKPEATDMLVTNPWISNLRTTDSGIGTPDSSVVASQKPSVKISDVTVEATGAPVSWEAAHKQRSSPKLDASATSSAVQHQAWASPSNGTGTTHHRRMASQAPSTMSRCPCSDCQAYPSPNCLQESNLRNDQPHRTLPSHQGLGSPLATTQAFEQTESPSNSGQPVSASGTQSPGARHSTSPGSRTEEISSSVNEFKATDSGAQKAKEKQQDSVNSTTETPVQDVKKDTSAQPPKKSSEMLELFYQSLKTKASSKSSTPTKLGATTASFSGWRSTSSLTSQAAAKAKTKTDYERGSTSSSRPVDSQTRSGATPQPSTSATGAQSSFQHAYAILKSNQTYTQRLYKKPTSGIPPATSSTSTKPAATSVGPTQPARPTSSLVSRPGQPALPTPRTKHQSPSLPSKPIFQTHAPAKQATLSTAQTQAGTSHQRPSGQTFRLSVASSGASNSLPVEKPKTKTASTLADPSSVPKHQPTAPVSKSLAQEAANVATISSVSTVRPSHPPQVQRTSQASTNQQASVRNAAETTVPKPSPQLSNRAAPGHIPPPFVAKAQGNFPSPFVPKAQEHMPSPFMPKPQPQMVTQTVTNPLPVVTNQPFQNLFAPRDPPQPYMPDPPALPVLNPFAPRDTPQPYVPNPPALPVIQPVANPLPPVTIQPPQIGVPSPFAPGRVLPPYVPNPQAEPVIQPFANPLLPVTVHQPQFQPLNLAAQAGIPPPQVPIPEPPPVIQPVAPPAPFYQPPQDVPAQANQPGSGKSVEEMKAEVLVLFPEADPAFVVTRLEEMKDYPAPINLVCNHLLENPTYPRAKKQEAPAKPTKTKAEGEKVDYIKDYYKIQAPRYDTQCVVLQLQNDFRMLSLDTIKAVWTLHGYHYAPTRVCLEEILRSNAAIQKILPRVKYAQHHERKVRVQITIKNSEGKEAKSNVVIHLLKGLRHLFYQGQLKPSPELQRQMDFYQQYVKNSALEKDLLLALSMNENEYEAEGQLIECGCCYAEVTFEKMIQCLDGHLFCESCLQMYAKQAVYGQGKAHLMCMTDGCDSSYPRDQLEKVLTSTDIAKYDERVQEESIQLASMDGLVRCPYCDFAAVLDPGDKVFSCQNAECLKETCRHCGEDWKEHFGKRCEEVEKKTETNMRLSYEERMSQLQIRTCHRCKTGIMKDQGCNKMTCRCGAKMCYICRKPNIDYNHFCSHARNPGQGCTQCTQCSLWTDPAEDDARAVKELEKELQTEREKLARAKDSRDRLGAPELAPDAKKQRVF